MAINLCKARTHMHTSDGGNESKKSSSGSRYVNNLWTNYTHHYKWGNWGDRVGENDTPVVIWGLALHTLLNQDP